MRVMVIIKANKDSEAGVMPSEKLPDRHGQLQRRIGQGRRHARGRGTSSELESQAREVFRRPADRHRWTIRGNKELIAGFWLWKVNSIDEAVEWVKRIPFDPRLLPTIPRSKFVPCLKRKISATVPPEARAQEDRLRAEMEKRKNS